MQATLIDGVLESLRIGVGSLLYVYRRGLGAPGQYRDPVCGMRTDDGVPAASHDDETYYFCSGAARRPSRRTPRSTPPAGRRWWRDTTTDGRPTGGHG